MERPRNLGKAIVLGVIVAAAHWFITMMLFLAIGFSAISSSPQPRIPYFIIDWAFNVCVFPLSQLSVVASYESLALNSALWGFSLAVVARWLWNRRKRPLAV